MKLIYKLEDKLFWVHNFLPNHEYKRIHNEIFKERKKLKYQDSSKTWNSLLINNLNAPNRLDIDPSYFNFYKTQNGNTHDWSKNAQGFILSAYFYGYISFQVLQHYNYF